MTSSRALSDTSRIASLGLEPKDVRLIIDVIKISKELRTAFEYSDSVDLMLADILFVNVENENAMKFLALQGPKMKAEPILVHKRTLDTESADYEFSRYPNVKKLSTPIKLVDLRNVLLSVVATPMLKAKPRLALTMKADCFKILVVDDSFPVRKYLEQKLPELMAAINPDLDFNIQYASSGQEAVNKVKAARGAYDIVFLDIMMEDIDGYKICKWIKKVKSSIDVVMLTSKSSPIDRVRANMSGCDSYLSKPPRDSHLKKVILKHRRFNTSS